MRQVPVPLGWEFPGWDLSHFAKFGIFIGILQNTLKYPKNGNLLFFPVKDSVESQAADEKTVGGETCLHF